MIQEIAIRKVKSGMLEQFKQARKNFIEKLKDNEGIVFDAEYASFFTMPDTDDTEVFVGTTIYQSKETVATVSEKLSTSEEANAFFSKFDMKAFCLATPTGCGPDEIIDYLGKSAVVEVAVRKPKPGFEQVFSEKRNDFFRIVATCPGYVFDCEYTDINTGDNVVLIGWENKQSFQNALGQLQTKNEMGAFFSVIDVAAYQATERVSV